MWNSISEYQLSDEADSSASIKILDRLGFDPLSELVDCHQYMGEAAPASPQWSNHIQSPNSKGLDDWNGLQGRRRLVRHVGVKLATFTFVDYVFCHFIRSWPIKPRSVCFGHNGPRGRMVTTGPRVDVVEDHSTFFWCYELLSNFGSTFSI